MKKCNESCAGCQYLRRKILKDKVLYAAWCALYKKDVSEKNEEEYETKTI